MARFFCLPNLATDAVTVSEAPWDFEVPADVLALDKEAYKKRWFSPETRHCLWSLVQGQNEAFAVSAGNQAAAVHGFAADYDGVFTPDIIEAVKDKPPSRFRPSHWCLSHSNRLHLVWLFDRPITVTGNAHAAELLHVVAAKIKAVRWGVGYDPDSEKPTQVMDIGREWNVFRENSFVPAEEIVMWDADLFRKSVRRLVDEVVDIPFEVVAEEVAKREWPHGAPERFAVGTRCVRFWDASADNVSGAQVMKDGIRVYTPHDNGFKSWKSLLGAEFCERYTATSMAPFYEDTTYCHTKDEYWRFFRADEVKHYERRTEKVLRRDLMSEARRDPKPAKGETLSQIDQDLYQISRRNAVDAVAPILYRKSGRIEVPGIGRVLNTSLVTVVKPAPRLSSATPEDIAAATGCPQEYRDDPSLCRWDNPFAVRGFPHIHRLLTCYFASGQRQYDSWTSQGCPLSDPRFTELLGNMQLMTLVSWMAHFFVNAAKMRSNPGRGQALILAGPTGTGKSFFARHLLSQLMGGATDGADYYLKGSRFTAQIVSAPVHYIDDNLGSRSQKERLRFTELLKITVANASLRYEAKFGSAVESIPWPGRIVIVANDDAQSMSVMPDLDMSTRDKFTMLKLGGAVFDWGTDEENQMWLAEELPYFARFLMGWRTPDDLFDERFGVRAVQHADMSQASAENGLTQILVEVLETCIEAATGTADASERTDADGWVIEGNAVKIFRWIKTIDDSCAREVIDSRTLHQCLSTLYRNGGYNISMDEATKRWRIPYVLRRKK